MNVAKLGEAYKSFFSSRQRLNEDICNLSTLCSEKSADEDKIDKSEILNALKVWQKTGNLPEDEIVSHVVKACSEVSWCNRLRIGLISYRDFFSKIPVLKEKLREKERQLTEIANNASNSNVLMTSSWHQAMSEAKRQYEAIDGALEVRPSMILIISHLICFFSFHSLRRRCTAFKASSRNVRSWYKCSATWKRRTSTPSTLCRLHHK